jgi:MscS family membrane protein
MLAGALLLGAPAARANGLLAALDASSPAATLQSFSGERARIERLYLTYRDDPSTTAQRALADAFSRVGTQLFDLSQLSPATRQKAGNAAVGQLADILARLPEIPPATIPGGPGWQGGALPARWTIPGTEIQIIRLADGQRAGDYVFSADTVARLPAFHARIAAEPTLHPTLVSNWVNVQHRITGPWLTHLGLERLPTPLQATLSDTPIWKILLSLVLGGLILALTLAWRGAVRRRAARMMPWRGRALLLTVPALFAALVMAGHILVVWQIIPSGAFAEAETTLAVSLLYLAGAAAAWHACWLLAEIVIASPAFPDNTYDAHFVRIVARVVSLLAAGLIIIYGANDIGVPALGLLAGVSVGGVALALAAQSTAANLLGGVAIFADRPFRVGEVIRYGAHTGSVEAVGPRSTRIRSPDGTLTTVPNGDLANAQISNMSARPSILFQHRVSLPDGATSVAIEALLTDLRRRIAAHPLVEAGPDQPRVRLVGLGTVAREAEIDVAAKLRTTEQSVFLTAQEELLLEILRGIEGYAPEAPARLPDAGRRPAPPSPG